MSPSPHYHHHGSPTTWWWTTPCWWRLPHHTGRRRSRILILLLESSTCCPAIIWSIHLLSVVPQKFLSRVISVSLMAGTLISVVSCWSSSPFVPLQTQRQQENPAALWHQQALCLFWYDHAAEDEEGAKLKTAKPPKNARRERQRFEIRYSSHMIGKVI